jgi:LytS/YehU family sensor histidine kinase
MKQLRTQHTFRQQLRELEMKALKAMMNPHFIHNALNSIQSLIIHQRTTEASHYISSFAKLLRQVLENADMNVISLEKELAGLQLYIELEKLRMNMDVSYEVKTDADIITSELKIPPLILQPFVENALWHGLTKKAGEKKITLAVTVEADWIYCTITDNGIGRESASTNGDAFPEGHLSKSISITKQRLDDYNNSRTMEPVTFRDLYENNLPAGTEVAIRIRNY